jgi:EmrB/QacA subfamily drug resistance transporter
MLPAGLLGDRYGRKRVLLGFLALFAAGSAACAYAPSAAAFIAARAVLGLAGAGIIVMVLSAITVLFDEGERPRAVGIWAAANFLALPVGPVLGGWLLTHYWWGWVFLMNVPVVLLGFLAAVVLVPESRSPQRPSVDPIGILSSTGGLAALVYGSIEAGRNGWTDPTALIFMAAGVLVLAGFFLWERRLAEGGTGRPLVDPGLFRSARFTWGVILAAMGGLASIALLFTLPQYFQGVEGADAMESGLRLLPLIAGLVLGALPADRIAASLGARVTVAVGFALLALGLILGATTGLGSAFAFVAVWTALVGAGMGLGLATAASTALSELPQEQSGVGSAVMQALQKMGGPLGTAIPGSVLISVYQARLALTGLPAASADAAKASVFGGVAVARATHSAALLRIVRAAFVHGMDVALVVSAGIAVAGMALAVLYLPGRIVRGEGNLTAGTEIAHAEDLERAGSGAR